MSFQIMNDTRDLHDLLRFNPEMEPPMMLAVSETDDERYSLLEAEHDPDVGIRLRDDSATDGLRRLLRHYPAPVYINGVEVERTPFVALPSIRILDGSDRLERIDPPIPNTAVGKGGYILLEGLLYVNAEPDHPGYIEDDGNVRRFLRMAERFACLPPDSNQAYVLVHNLQRDETTPDELDRCSFAEAFGKFHVTPGSPTMRAWEDDMESGRETVRQHALATARSLAPSK